MSEDVYVLKKKVGTDTLRCLNSGQSLSISLLWALQQEGSDSFGKYVPGDEKVKDWIAALKSGKKIVNPMSPREELEKTFKAAASYHEVSYCEGYKTGIETALSIIAKEHPDVADWIKESEQDV